MSKKPRVFSREFKLMVVRRMLAGEKMSALARETTVLRKDLYIWRDRYRSGGAEALHGGHNNDGMRIAQGVIGLQHCHDAIAIEDRHHQVQ